MVEASVLAMLPPLSTTEVGESSEEKEEEEVGREPAPVIVWLSPSEEFEDEHEEDMRVEGEDASDVEDNDEPVVIVSVYWVAFDDCLVDAF
jgi:hypothetical protein